MGVIIIAGPRECDLARKLRRKQKGHVSACVGVRRCDQTYRKYSRRNFNSGEFRNYTLERNV